MRFKSTRCRAFIWPLTCFKLYFYRRKYCLNKKCSLGQLVSRIVLSTCVNIKQRPAQVISCKLWEIFQSILFIEPLWTFLSVGRDLLDLIIDENTGKTFLNQLPRNVPKKAVEKKFRKIHCYGNKLLGSPFLKSGSCGRRLAAFLNNNFMTDNFLQVLWNFTL